MKATRATVVDRAPVSQEHALDLDRSNIGPEEVHSVDLEHLRQAIADCRVQLKAIAADLGVDQSYLTRMLSGEKPFPIGKLSRLPKQVRRRYYQLGAGMPDPHDVGRWFIAIGESLCTRVSGRPRMAKAGIR